MLTFEQRIEMRSLYQNYVSLFMLCSIFNVCEYQARRTIGMEFLPSLEKCHYCKECAT